jgi:AraC-like DNA-binding protein
VNGYRVQQVQEKLVAQSHENLTIYGIALEAGFNSQATFQRAFKNITGTSPREFMNQQLRKTA